MTGWVERAARAMFETEYIVVDGRVQTWEETSNQRRVYWLTKARAVISPRGGLVTAYPSLLICRVCADDRIRVTMNQSGTHMTFVCEACEAAGADQAKERVETKDGDGK